MESRNDLLTLLQKHIDKFPNDQQRLQSFAVFLKDHDGFQLIDRKNFTGHITASAFIVDKRGKSLLLLKHKFLERWLQPGGHVDATDPNLLSAALREAKEETGIDAAQLQLPENNLIDFDSHHIPANPRKNEAAHVHHDVRFLFRYTGDSKINFAEEESTSSKWILLTDLVTDEEFGAVAKKIGAQIKQELPMNC